MRRWFAKLPIHRKLVLMALVVTTTALVLATIVLMVLDLWRYRDSMVEDTKSLAGVIAENSQAAVTFEDAEATRTTLETVGTRPSVRRACLYLPNGSLFAGFERAPEFACSSMLRPTWLPWRIVAATQDVSSNGRVIGTVYVEQDLSEAGNRIVVAGLTGLGMLLLSGTFAFAMAHLIHRSVSTPIVELAAAARALRPDDKVAFTGLAAGEDEVGDLVRAFSEMVRRVQDANARLVESNEALQHQKFEREELLAREREASRLKDEFLAAVSHELRTPLNAIVGWVQILTTTKVDEQITAQAIASIARNAKVQTRVIEDLVDVSRIVTGKLTIRFDAVDVRDVAEAAAEAVRSAAHAKSIALRVRLPRDPCFVNGDRDRLQQIVWNLLSNAIKFTPQGGVVTLTLRCDDNTFELIVADTGIGIAPSFLPYVFDRFRQADGSLAREHSGLGLGLAIVKELTELHGGVVTAASPGHGQGATFALHLPSLAGFQVPGPSERAKIHTMASLKGMNILAVDDNADALEVLESSLSRNGARVRVAASGEQALQEWDREPADVLICDLAMPVINGFDVLRGVRERDQAAGRTTRAIALTAHASPDYRIRTREAGFDGHISKPFNDEDLTRTVLTVCGRT